jgi:hypothetical protein
VRPNFKRDGLCRMADQGIDSTTGTIWMAECTMPLRPLVSLHEFLQEFEPFGIYRDPGQHPHQPELPTDACPTYKFDRTFNVAGLDFLISVGFSDLRAATSPKLRVTRMFALGSKWKRETSLLSRLMRFSPLSSPTVKAPERLGAMEEQRLAYEKWLRDTRVQTAHEQTHRWGSVKLLYGRHECFHLQVDYFDGLR